MKYVNQLEYPHWLYRTRLNYDGEMYEEGKTTTVRSSGCGLCSAVMIAHRLIPNCTFELEDAMEISYEAGSNRNKGTTYKVFAPVFAEKMGFDLEMTNDPERLRYCLRTGGAAAIHARNAIEGYTAVFTIAGHMLIAINEERDGRIAVLDPSYKEGKYEIEGRKGKVEMTKEVIGLCDMETIVKDTEPTDPSFFLFWRK